MTLFRILLVQAALGASLAAAHMPASGTKMPPGTWTGTVQAQDGAVLLEPFDAVVVRCPSTPALSASATLDANGVAALPRGKRVILAGLSLVEAEGRLKELYERQLGVPLTDFRLSLTTDDGAPIRYLGEVKSRGTLFPSRGVTLGEVLALANPTEMADLESVELRSGGETRVVDAERHAGLTLRGGDRVYVPRLGRVRQIFVLGAVAKPGAYEFTRGMTAKRAVELAGGATSAGDTSQVEVRRGGRSLGALDFSFGDAPLQAGDTVSVPIIENPPHVIVTGGVVRPGRVLLSPNMSLRDAILGAGGVKPTIGSGKIKLVRIENGRKSEKTYDLIGVLTGQESRVVLKPNDRIELPEARG